MTYAISLSGTIEVTPLEAPTHGSPTALETLNRDFQEELRSDKSYDLSSDTTVVVALDGITNVRFLRVTAAGGKVRVRVTSADGALAEIPVDDLLVLRCKSVPITAVDLTRVAGATTSPRVEVKIAGD